MPPPSDPRNLRAKWQRALEERRKAGASAPPLDVTPRPETKREAKPETRGYVRPDRSAKRDAEARRDAALDRGAKLDASPDRGALPDAAPDRDAHRDDAHRDDASTRDASTRATLDADRTSTPEPDRSPDHDTPAAKPPAPQTHFTDADAPKRFTRSPDPDTDPAKKAAAPASPWTSVVAALVLVGGVGFAIRTFVTADTTPPPTVDEDPSLATAAATALVPPALPLPSARPPVVARCTPATKPPFIVGDAPAPRPATTATDDIDPPENELAPFAVELGRGVRSGKGFAVGTQRQAEGGTISMVATLSDDGDGKLVRLARSRGDFDPPVVAPAGAAILAAMMEPNAGGRAIRIAKIEGDRVTWGPELSEGHDESFAVDLAAAGSRALVVWDDVPIGHERSVIELATFDVETMRGSGARAITPSTIDADVPRLATRPGGFWLSYLVHGEPPTEPTAARDDAPEDAGDPKKRSGKHGSNNPDDSDTEAAGEAIAHQWIELLPLDESGNAAGAARAITPKESRVIAYDLDDGPDGRAVLIYREDDTPSGSVGGRVKVITAELGGIGEPRVIAEEGVGSGVPQLHGGWVVIHSLAGPVQLGAIGPHGDLVGELAPEASLRQGEILGAGDGAFLVGTPAGRAMLLNVFHCARSQ